MKKLMTFVSVLTLSTSAFAGFQGHNSAVKQPTTVAQAKKAYDDTTVSLSGYIVQKIGDEKYTFKDRTGQIRVEIDDELWGGLTATQKTKVRIYGQVDKDNGKTEIDVTRISK